MSVVVTQCCTQKANDCGCRIPIVCPQYDYVHCDNKDKCLASKIPRVPCNLKQAFKDIPAQDWVPPGNCWSQIATYASENHFRVVVADSAGKVLFDTNIDPILAHSSVAGTQEFVMAVNNGQGKAVRNSETGQLTFHYMRVVVNCNTGETFYICLETTSTTPYRCP